MRKSIVFTVTTDLSHDQRMQRIAGTLATAGFDVTLVGRQLPGSLPLTKQLYQQHRLTCRFLKGPLFYLEYNLRLIGWCMVHRFDLYGAVDADTALAGIFTTAWRRKPLVYDAHELFPEMPEVVNRPLVKRIWTWIEKQAFAKATVSYTVSASLVEYFRKQYKREVHLVRNMPVRQYGVPLPDHPPYFIYQGALNVGRGLEATIMAMQQVPARLVICGEGPLMKDLQHLVREAGVQDRVLFKGNVAPAELAAITSRAWAGIMLLENQGLSYYYSLANKFFDYVQAGIPQVCVPFPEYTHLNDRYAVAVFAKNAVEEVQAALLTLLHNKELYHTLRQNCLLAREEWCWEIERKHLIEIYNSLK